MTIRVQRTRKKNSAVPEGTLYAGRPTLFGNLYLTVEAFERWMRTGEVTVADLIPSLASRLNGREWKEMLAARRRDVAANLGRIREAPYASCWCGLDKPCHVDVLIRLAEEGFTL